MRLYGKKFLGNKISQIAESRSETRDAILWDVQTFERLCRVKIQGSNELIVAHYPENREQTPNWLKPGNSVRITHKGGARGRIEVVGHGQTIPVPIAGGTANPEIATPADCILSGCLLVQIPKTPRMSVMAIMGTLRVNGETKSTSAINMTSNASDFDMDMGGNIGNVAGVWALTAPSGISFQYVSFAVNLTDKEVYKFAGSVSNMPVKPTIPSGYIYIGHVLLYGGMTKITQADINREWEAVVPTTIDAAFRSSGSTRWNSTWATIETPAGRAGYVVDLKVLDQWGRQMSAASLNGWYFTIEVTNKDATVASVIIYPNYDSESGYASDMVTKTLSGSTTVSALLEIASASSFVMFKATLAYSTIKVERDFVVPC